MATFSIQTLGCKVNQYESEQVAALLRSQGWVETESDGADLRIVNTCSVTMEAASKSRQAIRRAAGTSDSKVVAMGCWTTSDKESAKRMSRVNMVLTHHDDVNARLSQFLAEGGLAQRRSLPVLEARQRHHQRAFLKIQDGCDAHCTYCIIPKLRPLLWSKPIDELVDEACRLVDAGHVEIVLTGIFLALTARRPRFAEDNWTVQRRHLPRRLKHCARAYPDCGGFVFPASSRAIWTTSYSRCCDLIPRLCRIFICPFKADRVRYCGR